MRAAELALEYFKALLSAPPMFSAVIVFVVWIFRKDLKSLLSRIAKIRFPGGAEVSTTQSDRLALEEDKQKPDPTVDDKRVQLLSDLSPQQKDTMDKLICSYVSAARFWEFRYLNYYFVPITQHVLDWLTDRPIAPEEFEAYWTQHIPSLDERKAIFMALQNHHLIDQDESRLIYVTPKGREYVGWRGPLASSKSTPTQRS